MTHEYRSTSSQSYTPAADDSTDHDLPSLRIDLCAPTIRRLRGPIAPRQVACFCDGKGCPICNGIGYMTLAHITYLDDDNDDQESK